MQAYFWSFSYQKFKGMPCRLHLVAASVLAGSISVAAWPVILLMRAFDIVLSMLSTFCWLRAEPASELRCDYCGVLDPSALINL